MNFRPAVAICLLTFVSHTVGPALAQDQPIPVGAIDFYGYGGIDIDKIRAALPVHIGDSFPTWEAVRAMSPKIREIVLQMTGKPATGLSNVQIEKALLIYIGLAGSTMKKFPLNPAPTGSAVLTPKMLDLYDQKMDLWPKSVAAGAPDDQSKGYALSSMPELRTVELAIRDYALQNEDLILNVLKTASDPKQRIAASDALGYAKQSQTQIDALVAASHDPDSYVRNNATRALGVLAESDPKTAAQIPAEPFIQMLSSESWTDRNKAGFVLQALTSTRDPEVLSALRAQALGSLIEMAKWHEVGHAVSFRIILGRIGGIDEKLLNQKVWKNDQVDDLITAAHKAERF
jgi:hypothetical protein